MKEEILILGKNNPKVTPELHIWEWPIALYLYLGGLAAGILVFAALYYLRGKEDQLPSAVKWAVYITPPTLIVGLAVLFFDLKNKWMFWRLYTTIRIESPMSWGAWTLLIILPIAILWCMSYQKQLMPWWSWKYQWLEKIEKLTIQYRKFLAWPMLFLGVILGIYTGILLSAFNARPLWNTSILGFLFLVSGLSTAAVTIMWLSQKKLEIELFRKIDVGLILAEIVLFVHFFMGMLAGPEVQVAAAGLFLGGPFTWSFWGLVFGLGLLIPLILEIQELRGKRIPVYVVPLLVLIGGFIFRIIIVHAGQISSYTMG